MNFLAVVILAASGAASAHPLNTSSSHVTLEEGEVRVVVNFSLDNIALTCGLDVDGDKRLTAKELEGPADRFYDCVKPYYQLSFDSQAVDLRPDRGAFTKEEAGKLLRDGPLDLGPNNFRPVALVLTYRTTFEKPPEAIRMWVRLHEILGEEHGHIAYIKTGEAIQPVVFSRNEERREFLFQAGKALVRGGGFPKPRRSGSLWGNILTFTLLGIEHISIGYDHILFLLALLLLGGRFMPLLKIVTAFTAAHSVTLILAALGVVVLPTRFVESCIALSIVYVAAENYFLDQTGHRWIPTFFFGLMHGFGFAKVLAETGLPTRGLVPALLAFNVGVELGQLVIVGAFFPAVLWLSRKPYQRRVVNVLTTVILLFGLGWFVDRAFSLSFMPI